MSWVSDMREENARLRVENARLRALLDERTSGELAGRTDSRPSAAELLPELAVIRRVMFGKGE